MLLDTPFRNSEGNDNAEGLSPSAANLNIADVDDFGNLFCDSPSAPSGKTSGLGGMRMAAKMALDPTAQSSSSPGSSVDSPSIARLGPTLRGMERAISVNAASGGLFGSSVRLGMSAARRTQPYKRPQLAPFTTANGTGCKISSTASALPMLENNSELQNGLVTAGNAVCEPPRRPNGLSMRRAFSVCDQGKHVESFDENTTTSNASSGRVLSTIETSSSSAIHPLIHVGGRLAMESATDKPHSPFAMSFGVNEMDGKILPCHRVKEDGLVRITHETVSFLLALSGGNLIPPFS
jgi:M-phase inducer tyrosine phosphatase